MGGWGWRSQHLACVKSKAKHSHHLRPGHGVLVGRVVGIPVAKTVHVTIWMHVASFVRHWDLPKLGQARWAGGDRAAAVEMLFWSAAMFHDFFVFGALILEPYFHLEANKTPQSSTLLTINTDTWKEISAKCFLLAYFSKLSTMRSLKRQ